MPSDFFTIPGGQTDSQEIRIGDRAPLALMFISPSLLPETVNIIVKGTTLAGCLKSGTDRIILTAGDTQQAMICNGISILLRATTAVGSPRTFEMVWVARERTG